MKEQILFIDDEPSVLNGLGRMLRSMRGTWDMRFASDASTALKEMETQCFDVIITDMRMPSMSGAELLSEVRKVCPRSVRIILSGQADLDQIFTAVGTTHQYLAKPCDPEMLRTVVANACALRDRLPSPALKVLVSKLRVLRPQKEKLTALRSELAQSEPKLEVIHELISTDIALAVHILQLVNSAFFGPRQCTASLAHAVSVIGFELLRKLFLKCDLYNDFPPLPDAVETAITALNLHSVETAFLCKQLALSGKKSEKEADSYYAAGLMHDVGRLILLSEYRDEYLAITKSDETELTLCEAEEKKFGASHAEIGSYLLGLWGIPGEVTEATARHHALQNEDSELSYALYVADYLTYKLGESHLEKKVDTQLLKEWRTRNK